MKKIYSLIQTIAFTLSLYAFTTAGFAEPKTDIESQLATITNPAPTNLNLQVSLYQAHEVNPPGLTESAIHSTSELLTELGVYLIIIAIYSIYWFLFCSRNASD